MLFSIIVPIYNEKECLPELSKRILDFRDKFKDYGEIEVLLVDDGSRDGSSEIIDELAFKYEIIKPLHLAKNYGLSTAIKAGIDFANGDVIGYIDGDLQVDVNNFLKFFPYISEFEMINGIRVNRRDGFVKRISSRIANSIRSFIIKDNIKDTCCPLKIIKKDYAKNLFFFNGFHRFIPFLVMLQKGRVAEVEIEHFSRISGSSKYNLLNRLINPFLDTLGVLWIKKRRIEYEIK